MQVLKALAFLRDCYPRLADLAAEALFEQLSTTLPKPDDHELDALQLLGTAGLHRVVIGIGVDGASRPAVIALVLHGWCAIALACQTRANHLVSRQRLQIGWFDIGDLGRYKRVIPIVSGCGCCCFSFSIEPSRW